MCHVCPLLAPIRTLHLFEEVDLGILHSVSGCYRLRNNGGKRHCGNRWFAIPLKVIFRKGPNFEENVCNYGASKGLCECTAYNTQLAMFPRRKLGLNHPAFGQPFWNWET